VRNLLSKKTEPSGVLIFLSGVEEIRQCINAISRVMGDKATVLPLHGSLSSAEQRPVFEKTRRHKIVAATNVAEVHISACSV
jgi:ATP-dependent RNA helicase DHX57